MDNKERLQKLKHFQITEKNKADLRSREFLLSWIDNVSPLLKYDPQHYNTFINSARTASGHLSSRTITYYLDIAKSTVNQAIIELENNIDLPTQNTTPKSTTDITDDEQNPVGNTLKKIAIGIVIIVLGAATLWVLNYYFGLSL